MKTNCTILLLSLCFASCSFNKSFYQADKIPAAVKQININNMYSNGSSSRTVLNIGADFQPTFTDTLNNVLPLTYTIESVVFSNRSGKKLNGWFIKAKGQAAATITLLFLHGNGGNVFSQYQGAAALAQQGFQVFVVDYSGYGFSEGKPTRKGVLADATDALNYVRSRPDVQGTKLVIYGQSLGGHLAAVVAQRNEAKVDGLVTEGAFSSHKDIAAHMFRPLGFAARLLVRERYTAKRSIHRFHKPVLVIHSTEDKVVPFYMGQRIYAHANAPKSFYEIKYAHINGPLYYADSIAARINAMESK